MVTLLIGGKVIMFKVFLNTGQQEVGGNGDDVENEYLSITNSTSNNYGIGNGSETINYYRWYQDTNTNEIRFIASGTQACGSKPKRRANLCITFEVFRAESTIVFETQPKDSQPDVWYEGSETFDIVKRWVFYLT